jgi:hypothetical protein
MRGAMATNPFPAQEDALMDHIRKAVVVFDRFYVVKPVQGRGQLAPCDTDKSAHLGPIPILSESSFLRW